MKKTDIEPRFVPINELHRHFLRLRGQQRVKAEATVFIRYGSKYSAHMVVIRLANGRWTCSNDRVAHGEFFSYRLHERGKLDILRALVALKVVSEVEFTVHEAEVKARDAKRDREGDIREMNTMAEKLGFRVLKKKK